MDKYGYQSTKDVKKIDYDKMCTEIENAAKENHKKVKFWQLASLPCLPKIKTAYSSNNPFSQKQFHEGGGHKGGVS